MVRALLMYGASTDIENNEGKKPIDFVLDY